MPQIINAHLSIKNDTIQKPPENHFIRDGLNVWQTRTVFFFNSFVLHCISFKNIYQKNKRIITKKNELNRRTFWSTNQKISDQVWLTVHAGEFSTVWVVRWFIIVICTKIGWKTYLQPIQVNHAVQEYNQAPHKYNRQSQGKKYHSAEYSITALVLYN